MKKTIFPLLLAPAVLAAAAFTSQAAQAATTLHVPFRFAAAGHAYPAGDYMVRSGNLDNSVSLEGPAGKLFFLAGPGDPNPRDKRVILTFDKYGSRYLLRTVQYGARITNRLDKPRREGIPEVAQVMGQK